MSQNPDDWWAKGVADALDQLHLTEASRQLYMERLKVYADECSAACLKEDAEYKQKNFTEEEWREVEVLKQHPLAKRMDQFQKHMQQFAEPYYSYFYAKQMDLMKEMRDSGELQFENNCMELECPFCQVDIHVCNGFEWLNKKTLCPKCQERIAMNHSKADGKDVFWFVAREAE